MSDKLEQPVLPQVSICGTCHGRGGVNIARCPTCKGSHVWYGMRSNLYYIGTALTTYQITYRKWKRVLHGFEIIGAVVASVAFFGLLGQRMYEYGLFPLFGTPVFWKMNSHNTQTLFWAGIISLSFLLYRIWSNSKKIAFVETKKYDKEEDVSIEIIDDPTVYKRNKKIDITKTYTDEVWRVVEHGYLRARNSGASHVEPAHIFLALLDLVSVKSMFLRLGVSPKLVYAKIQDLTKKENKKTDPLLSKEVTEVLLGAYEYARKDREEHVYITALLQGVIASSSPIREALYDITIEEKQLQQVIAWVRIREQLRRKYSAFRRAAGHTSKKGMDRAMTAIATPFLNQFSIDLTTQAVLGHVSPCVGREKELDEIFRIVESGAAGILLVGGHGVGKMSIIEGMVERIIKGDVPKYLQEKRVVQVSSSALLAGTTTSGAQERLLRMMSEVRRAGNIVLFMKNIHDLMAGAGDSEGLDVSETLAEYIGSGQVMAFATTTPQGQSAYISNSQLSQGMRVIQVKEMDHDQAIQALEAHVGGIEYKHNVFFSYHALDAAVTLSKQFLHDIPLPKSAISLSGEVASAVRRRAGNHQFVTKEDVAAVIHDKTGIPITSISHDESTALLALEKEMHLRVIGQDSAVQQVANALRRARAGVRQTNRPIASFLFMGPTGVGKTELAKTISSVYFGGEDRMIRVDMSEYQTPDSVYRLIGRPGVQGSGLLTEAVRKKPFSLILLDEFEKANPALFDLFLQVFDDGRLTDSIGRVIDFTNTIIITTSNAGTKRLQEHIRAGHTMEEMQQDMTKNVLQEYFRPELLNRFDGVVLFKPLTKKEVQEIAVLMLRRIEKELDTRGIAFRVEDTGMEALIRDGYDQEFGARPMRRAIVELIENPLATLLVRGGLRRRDTVVFNEQGLRVE
ncbi:MAG: AAA domain-containing protein [Candidatus Magasanikbacteria bacterium]|jgi:ATP-dependent Clp protease ATP-binding subunit ClpC|nr:AAA domain-containing protein [Candidatus Magasanikbacteria bacterium]MBT4071876.1 AAA domain-containing protein [Candidatus Magasanikbacteria bacterium]